MVDQEDKSITAMIAKMQRKRNELVTELEKVQEWLSQLDTILNRGKVIIGDESTSAAPPPAAPSPENKETDTIKSRNSESISGRILRLIDKPDAEKTQSEKVRQILQESDGPLSVPQIDAKFSEKGWPIEGEHRNQIIRNALIRKSVSEKNKKSKNIWFVLVRDKMWDLAERVNLDAQAQ